MTAISDAADAIIQSPAPVLIIDTCCFLDLFRRDDGTKWPRVPSEEIGAAAEFLKRAKSRPSAVHIVVPELVPLEFQDNADDISKSLKNWSADYDDHQLWLFESVAHLGLSAPHPAPISALTLPAAFRKLAEELLAQAIVIGRDQRCLELAIERVIQKRRPSHKKEIKDSMNLEQSLELARRLRAGASGQPCLFVSSNTNDYAETSPRVRIHPALQPEFAAVEMDYVTSFRAALGRLNSP